MSGGVDSSVAAFLLQKEGYEVMGVFIDFIGGDKSEIEFRKAQEVAKKLGISIHKFDAQKEFKERIIDEFVNEYKNGITPNPCVICNSEMKFRILIEEANRLGIDKVATGHYACIEREFPISPSRLGEKIFCRSEADNLQFPNKVQIINSKCQEESDDSKQLRTKKCKLKIAKDDGKDQSYFLYRLNQEQLKRIIFPLGEYLKSEVREIAKENDFKIKTEEESQDVCFIANNDFVKFIGREIKNSPGDIVDKNGIKLGEHKGLHFYTIGQRKGINLGGNGPHYVIRKDKSRNQLIVSNNVEDLNCPDGIFEIKQANWIDSSLVFPLKAGVKTRYRSQQECAIINKKKEGVFEVKFEKNQKSITSGQSAVFFGSNGEVIGGGIII